MQNKRLHTDVLSHADEPQSFGEAELAQEVFEVAGLGEAGQLRAVVQPHVDQFRRVGACTTRLDFRGMRVGASTHPTLPRWRLRNKSLRNVIIVPNGE